MEAVIEAGNGQSGGARTEPISVLQYMQYCDEVRTQPNWRFEADKAADYYDGNQLTQEKLNELAFQKLGISGPTNLIKPAIDTVLGIEAKMRQDWRVAADDDQWMDVAEALSAKLHEAERMTRADRACSEAYASQLKSGLGWVEVNRNPDPFGYPYRAVCIHRREMFWDWSSREPDLGDSRYLMRRKWYPIEQAKLYLPKKADLIQAAGTGWDGAWLEQASENVSLASALEQETRISQLDWDWRNIDQKKVCLNECWYPVYVRGYVITLPDERTVEFDRRNAMHVAAVERGLVQPRLAVYRKMRASIWLGPHRLQDIDIGGNKLPYVPFWGYREDLTGVPYGLVRSMMPLQDEINARRQRLMWLLQSKRVMADSDALDKSYNTFDDLLEEINRPDSVTIMNPSRKNAEALRVESDLGLSQQQFEVMTEAKETIQQTAGIFNSMMGRTDGAKSGIAIASLVEQGSNTLGELNDNFRFARNLVGERLLDLIKADLSGKQVKVMTEERSGRRKMVMLNAPALDEATGIRYRENDVDKAQVKVVLEDVPQTPTYRAQQLQMISDTLSKLPPEAAAPMIPFFLEATELKDRKQMAKALRQVLGLVDPNSGEEVDPQVAQLQQQIQAMQQQMDEMANEYEAAVKEASGNADELAKQLQLARVELKNKEGELALRQQEVQAQREMNEANAIAKSRELRMRERELGMKETTAQVDVGLKVAKTAHDIERGSHEMEHKDRALDHTIEKGSHDMERGNRQEDRADRQQQHQEMRDEISDVHADADRASQMAQQERQFEREDEVRAGDQEREDKIRKEDREAAVEDRDVAIEREDEAADEEAEIEKIVAKAVKAAVKEAVTPLKEQIKALKQRSTKS